MSVAYYRAKRSSCHRHPREYWLENNTQKTAVVQNVPWRADVVADHLPRTQIQLARESLPEAGSLAGESRHYPASWKLFAAINGPFGGTLKQDSRSLPRPNRQSRF